MEGLGLSAGLRRPLGSTGGAGESVWGSLLRLLSPDKMISVLLYFTHLFRFFIAQMLWLIPDIQCFGIFSEIAHEPLH